MHFSFRGRDSEGSLQEGFLEAMSQDAAANELMQRGITPLAISEQAKRESLRSRLEHLPLFRKPVSLDELIVFCRQMHALTRAGIPIIRVLRGLADTARSPVMTETLDDLAARLEGGNGLAVAMQSHKKVFSDLFIAMVHVGENTGELDAAFKQLSHILELERDTKRRVKQALRYPTFVLFAVLGALLVVNFLVIPKFASVFDKLGADLPFLTQVLVATSDFLIAFWPAMLVLTLGSWFGFKAWTRTEQGQTTFDRYKLRLPIVGSLLEQITLSRFSRNFANTLAAGMPITTALTVTADATDNAWISSHIRGMRTGIERGDSLLRTARHSEMFTPLILQMIAVGEETGSVDDMLVNVADFYDEEVDYSLKRLADAIEPILIVVMGILVLVLALGVFLPIWDLGAAALGRS